jgi:hypothetical protein
VADPPESPPKAVESNLDQEFVTLLEAGGLNLGEPSPETQPPAPAVEVTPDPVPEPPAAEEGEPIPPDDTAPSPEPSPQTEPIEELPPAIEKMQKRINQVTARAKAAETLVDELRAKLDLVSTPKPTEELPQAPQSSDPAEATPEVSEARKAEAKATAERTRARELRSGLAGNPEAIIEEMKALGVNLPSWEPDYVSRFLDAVADNASDRVASARLKAELAIARNRDGRDYRRSQVSALAEQRFPWLKDETSPLYQAAQNIIQARPWLSQDPYGQLMAAVWADYLARQKPTGTPRPAQKPNNGRPTMFPAGAPARAQEPTASGDERRMAAWNKVQKAGDDVALEAALAEDLG